MVADIIRDSTIGQLINSISNGRFLPYQDQRPDYVVPARFSTPLDVSDASTLCDDEREQKKSGTSTPMTVLQKEETLDEKDISMKLDKMADPNIVGWYGDDDPDNPR